MLGPLLLAAVAAAPAAAEAPAQPQERVARLAAAATSEENATAAAAGVLAEGGNAVDAAVAAGFALAASYPIAGNLGGGGFLLYRTPDGEAWFLDFREVAPAAAGPDLYRTADGGVDKRASRYGWRAAGVPGSVPGLLEAHRRWGSLPRERLLSPAIEIARRGLPVSEREHRRLRASAKDLLRDPLARRRFFTADGEPVGVGRLIVQPELAATLEQVAKRGADAFRDGILVEELVEASRAGGGILAAADFRDYRPVLRPVHRFEWAGLELIAAPPPSSGGIFLQQVLRSLEGHALAEWGPGDARTVQLLGEATARAFADRNRWLGDPAGFDFPFEELLDEQRLRWRAASLSPQAYTPPEALHPTPLEVAEESEETTHYSVVDALGGACAVTTTLNGAYGAKVMAPGGFLMNNEMDDFAAAPGVPNQFGLVQGEYNAVRPGRRPLSSMCPVIVVRDGQLDAVVGSPGGPTILTTVLQVLLNRYVFGMAPRASVAAPRFHRQDRPPHVQHEADGLQEAVLARLAELGQPVRVRRSIGDVNAIFREGRQWRAVPDPRSGGTGMIVSLTVAEESADGR